MAIIKQNFAFIVSKGRWLLLLKFTEPNSLAAFYKFVF